MMGMSNVNPPPEEEIQTAAEWRIRHLLVITPEAWEQFREMVRLAHAFDSGAVAALEKATADSQRLLRFEDFCQTRLAEIDKLEEEANQNRKLAVEELTRAAEHKNEAAKWKTEFISMMEQSNG